jgi:hypothetical protein
MEAGDKGTGNKQPSNYKKATVIQTMNEKRKKR